MLEDFIKQFNGSSLDFDHNSGSQCVDLAKAWEDWNDWPIITGNAKDQFRDISGYTKIVNTKTGVPQKGDIVIWGADVGKYGHIAVFIDGNATNFRSFDQNWPVGSVCHIQSHNYNGVLGWLRGEQMIPRNLTQNELFRLPDGRIFWHIPNPSAFDSQVGSDMWNAPQNVEYLGNAPAPVIQTITVDKPVPVEVDILTDEEKASFIAEYEKAHPPVVKTEYVEKPITVGQAISFLWNAIKNIKLGAQDGSN